MQIAALQTNRLSRLGNIPLIFFQLLYNKLSFKIHLGIF